jgi:putative aminopeptidase FrvX
VAVPPLLDALLRAHGPTGHEHLAFDAVREGAGDVAEIETDAIGNLVARRAGTGEGPLLALFTHLDVIGLAAAHVDDDGLIPVHTLGGWRAAIAYGQRVEISTANGPVTGLVARRTRDDEKVEWDQLYVDVGARDGAEARALVAPGDPMIVAARPVELAAGRVASRSLDNRAGVYVALEALRRLAAEDVVADVAVVAGAHEELGAAGAAAAAHRLRPDVGIAIDVTYATDVPAGDPNKSGDHRLGGGAAIFRGPQVSPLVFDALVEAARTEGIAYTVETGMRTYTDADRTFASRDGVPMGVVSIPLRYMHSPIEVVELTDLEECVKLVVAFARGLRPGASYAR